MIHGGDVYSKKIEYDFSVNLNPVACPDAVAEGLKAAISDVSRYPDITQKRAREAVASLENVKAGNVFLGNGASELIMMTVRMLNPKSVVLLKPSFYGYMHAIKTLSDCNVIFYGLSKDNEFLVTEELIEFIKDRAPELVIISNPNNPTGRVLKHEMLVKLIEAAAETDTKILVDECFLRMSEGAVSVAPLALTYRNLYVVNAFTKLFSIPGVRVGYIVTNEENLEKLVSYLPEWNLSVFAEYAAIECVRALNESDTFISETLKTIKTEREYLVAELRGLLEEVYPSDTSFILVKSSRPLYELLLKEKILIRDCSNFEGLKKSYYRIAVKDHESNMILVETLRKALRNGN